MSTDPGEELGETRAEIMRATFDALCEHGYANLTMQDIADEFDKSKSLLHYHYETKETLLLAFIDWIVGWIDEQLEKAEGDDPITLLETYIDRFVIEPGETDREGFAVALFELRLQAVHNDAFREKLVRQYERNVEAGAGIVEDGIEDGVFREVDPETTAEALYTALQGARMYQVMLGADHASRTMGETLKRFVVDEIVVEE